jgi:hypothetical protein
MNFFKYPFDTLFKDFSYKNKLLILGETGSGKSNWLCYFLYWMTSVKGKRIIYFNPIKLPEIRKLADIDLDEKDVIEGKLTKALNNYDLNLICITPTDNLVGKKKRMQLWDFICYKCYFHEDKIFDLMMKQNGMRKGKDYLRQANIYVATDELVGICDNEDLSKWHEEIIYSGRNYGIGHIGASQRNQKISKFITTQTDYYVYFRMEQYDIYALRMKMPVIHEVAYLDSVNRKYHWLLYHHGEKYGNTPVQQLIR